MHPWREQGAVLGRGVGEKIVFFVQARRRRIFQGADLTVCPDGKFAPNAACAGKASFTNVPRPKPNTKEDKAACPKPKSSAHRSFQPNGHNKDPYMNYLVTGGLGYVGSWAVRHLAQAGHNVFALSRKAEKPDLGAPYSLVQADLASQSPEQIAAVLPQGLDGIVHAASLNEAFIPNYPREALLANALGTRNLLEALVLAHKAQGAAPLPVVVYCSTFHVYGKSEGEITEATPPDPKNDYAITHLFAEQYCRMFGHTAGMPCITVRLSNGYGAPVAPGFDKWHLIINDLCRQAVEQGSLTLNANPAIERDFLWQGDIARCFELLLPRRDLAGQTFVAATQRTVSLGEVAELIASTARQMLGKPVPIHYKTPSSPCPRLQVRATTLHQATGFTPTGDMEQEIRAIIAMCIGQK